MSDATEELKAKMEKFNTTVDTIAAVTGRLGAVDTKVNAAVGEIAKVDGDMVLNEQLQETRYAAVQQQMATLTSVQSGTSSGCSGPRPGEPLATHKLLIGKERLTGAESYAFVDDWYEEMTMDIEFTMPGARQMFEESVRCKPVIDCGSVLQHYNQGLATKRFRELYVLLMNKTSDQAKNQLKSLLPDQGLEG